MSKLGDWYCFNCNQNIFRSKSQCTKYQAKKPNPPKCHINSAYIQIYDQVLQKVQEEKSQTKTIINQ